MRQLRQPRFASAADAAFVNAVAAHALDFDDTVTWTCKTSQMPG